MKNIPKITHVVVFIFMAMWFMPQKDIEGVVRLVGTSLFPSLILETDDGDVYYIDESLFDEFVQYQHLRVKVRARIKEEKFISDDYRNILIQKTIVDAKFLDFD